MRPRLGTSISRPMVRSECKLTEHNALARLFGTGCTAVLAQRAIGPGLIEDLTDMTC